MRRVSLYAVLALLLCAFFSPSPSRADSITYDLNNFVFQDGSTLTGSFTVDSLHGGGISSDIFSSYSGNTYIGIFEATSNVVQFQGVMGIGDFPFVDITFSGSLFSGVPLSIDPQAFNFEDAFPGGTNFLVSGSVIPVATPEPSSVFLLGLGLLTLTGLRIKKVCA